MRKRASALPNDWLGLILRSNSSSPCCLPSAPLAPKQLHNSIHSAPAYAPPLSLSFARVAWIVARVLGWWRRYVLRRLPVDEQEYLYTMRPDLEKRRTLESINYE